MRASNKRVCCGFGVSCGCVLVARRGCRASLNSVRAVLPGGCCRTACSARAVLDQQRTREREHGGECQAPSHGWGGCRAVDGDERRLSDGQDAPAALHRDVLCTHDPPELLLDVAAQRALDVLVRLDKVRAPCEPLEPVAPLGEVRARPYPVRMCATRWTALTLRPCAAGGTACSERMRVSRVRG